MIQNHFKGKISLQYRSQVTRLRGNRPSLWPAVMERCVGQRVLISWREVKACGEHLRYSMMGTLLLSSGTYLRYMFTEPGSMGDKQEDLQVHAQSQGYHVSEVTETWRDRSQLECYSVWLFRKDRLWRQIISKTLYQLSTGITGT